MKLPQSALTVTRLVNQAKTLAASLNQTQHLLVSLQKQDRDNSPLYQLLRRQSLFLADWLRSAQFHWDQPPNSMDHLQVDLQNLTTLAQLHCQLVAWLAAGEDSAAANKFDLPKSPAPPAPKPPQGSNAPAGQPLAFD